MKVLVSSLRIALVYIAFSLLWYITINVLFYLFGNYSEFIAYLREYQNIFFIIFTSLLIIYLVGTKDIAINKMQEELTEQKTRLEHVIKGSNLGYWDWNYVSNEHEVNDIWLSLLGLTKNDLKDDIGDWDSRVHPDDREAIYDILNESLKNNNSFIGEMRMRHKDGHWVWIETAGSVVEVDEITKKPIRLTGTHRDISDRKKAEEEVLFLAHYDQLTKLPNRALLKIELEKLLLVEESLAFIFLDLDRFKHINDTHGHTVGDKVLQIVSERFKGCLYEKELIARVGDDEFVVVTSNLLGTDSLCRSFLKSLDAPIEVNNAHFRIGVSMGVACFPKDGDNFETLFKHADIAMYEAKSSSKIEPIAFYNASMTEYILSVSKLDNDLKGAIVNDEFVIFFQPQINLTTSKVCGLEALVRWQHPEQGIVAPSVFIKRAEETKQIILLGKLIFRKILNQMKIWQDNLVYNGVVAINISGVQIEDENFIKKIEDIRHDVGIEARFIELEVTESSFSNSPAKFTSTLDKLKKLDIRYLLMILVRATHRLAILNSYRYINLRLIVLL